MRTIVSLTSYGKRITETLPTVLKSIAETDGLNPDRIILYLTDTDAALVPDELKDTYGVTVETAPDIRSYKKYLALADRQYDDCFVLIVDDDIVLRRNTWTSLTEMYGRHPEDNCIYAKVCAKRDRNGRYARAEYDKPLDRFLFWSGRGLMIPPRKLRFDTRTLNDGFDTVPTDDDAFMSIYCETRNITCRCSYDIQTALDFNGNTKLFDVNKNMFRTNIQKSMTRLGHPDADTIADRVESLFNQSLRPDKVFLYVPESYKPTKKITELTERHSVTLIKSDNPSRDRWTPDTDPDDLVFFIDDTEHGRDLIESMYTEYYKSPTNGSMQRRSRLAYIPSFGHRHLVNPSRAVIRRKHLDGLTLTDDAELSVTETVLRNTLVFNKPQASFQQA